MLSSLTNSKNFSLKVTRTDFQDFWTKDKRKNQHNSLNNFLWLSLIDRKEDASLIRKIITLWIKNNFSFNRNVWDNSTTSLRIISWVLNSDIILNSTNYEFKRNFLQSIIMQSNHLKKSFYYENDKVIQVEILTSIILTGLVFKEYSNNFDFGIKELGKIIPNYFDNNGFPLSRSPNELIKFLKYFIITKECIKDSQRYVPENLELIIKKGLECVKYFTTPENGLALFNGAAETSLDKFYDYINHLNIKIKNIKVSVGGIHQIKCKNQKLFIDMGNPPEKKYSKDYQSGPLSFEYFFDNEKIITNCGFGSGISHKAKILSKLTSAQSTLCINDTSVVKFERSKFLIKAFGSSCKESFKISEPKKISDKNEETIKAHHDAYIDKFGFLHKRELIFDKNRIGFNGQDYILRKKYEKKIKYSIYFHLRPGLDAVKTISGDSILIKANKNKSLIFLAKESDLSLEKSIFLGGNKIINNLCIRIYGELEKDEKIIKWEIRDNI